MKRILAWSSRHQPGFNAALYLTLLMLPGGSVLALIAWWYRRKD